MTTVEESLTTCLLSITGTSFGIYPLLKPEKTNFPAVVYTRVSTQNVREHSATYGLNVVRMQVSCWDETYKGAKELAGRVKSKLDVNTTAFNVSYLDNQREFVDEEGPRNVQIDFMIWSNGE